MTNKPKSTERDEKVIGTEEHFKGIFKVFATNDPFKFKATKTKKFDGLPDMPLELVSEINEVGVYVDIDKFRVLSHPLTTFLIKN